jgi:S-adenosylmethionine synthetase
MSSKPENDRICERLRFAEAVCEGHPDRLCDLIASRIVALACSRDDRALVGVEVAIHRSVVFIDGRIASGAGRACAVREAEIVELARAVFRECGYGDSPSGTFTPGPEDLDVRLDVCLGPLEDDERAVRDVSDDQAIAVGYAVQGARAGYRPLEQALANDFVAALESLRRRVPGLRLGPDGKVLVVVSGTTLVGVSVSVHHAPGAEWLALAGAVREACESVAAEYVRAGELKPLGEVDWLVNGAGAFEIGGPQGDNGLSGKKLVAQAYGTSVPIGGGAVFGKDPLKVDPRGQRLARQMALDLVKSGAAREATVWLAWRPGDVEPRWVEFVTEPPASGQRASASSSSAPNTSLTARTPEMDGRRTVSPGPTSTAVHRSPSRE